MPVPVAPFVAAVQRKGQNAAPAPFVGAYDAIPNLVHVYEPARCTLSAYTGGALLRLRRDSDDAESDFSHVSASDPELDVAAIAAWAGGASYIVSVYDQVSGDTVTQAAQAAQPLFNASILNGHAGGLHNGLGMWLQGAFTLGGALSQPFMIYAVVQMDSSIVLDSANHYFMDGDDTTNRMAAGQTATTNPDTWYFRAGSNLTGGTPDANAHVWSVLANGLSSQIWIDAVSVVSGSGGTNNPDGITIGAYPTGANVWKGPIVAVAIVDPSHTDEQRGAMQTAMNAYWGVYA